MFDAIKKFFQNLPAVIGRFLNSKQVKAAAAFTAQVNDLIKIALPAVELIAAATPNKTDDEVIAIVAKLEAGVAIDASKPLSDLDKQNLLFDAACHAIKGELADAISAAGGAGLKVGEAYIFSVTGIPQSILDTAVQAAYGYLHNVLQAK